MGLKEKDKGIMREPILKSVAMPPRVFWAPMVPFIVNFVIQGTVMLAGIGLFSINPLIFLFTFLIVHVAIVAYSAKEPHMSHLLQAWGQNGPTMTKNIYYSRGNKFAP